MDHIETAILNCYGIREAEQIFRCLAFIILRVIENILLC